MSKLGENPASLMTIRESIASEMMGILLNRWSDKSGWDDLDDIAEKAILATDALLVRLESESDD